MGCLFPILVTPFRVRELDLQLPPDVSAAVLKDLAARVDERDIVKLGALLLAEDGTS